MSIGDFKWPFDWKWSMKNWKRSLLLPSGFSTILALVIVWGAQPEASGLGRWYEQYADWIRHGFTHAGTTEAQTFPMWGYGWLLALVRWPELLVYGQISVNLFGSVLLLQAMVKSERITREMAVCGAWMLAFYLPWYASFTAAYSAPAFGMGFLLVALALLIYWLGRSQLGLGVVLAAALAFGAALNFRSDYFAFTPVVAVVLLYGAAKWSRGFAAAGIWLGGVLIAMVPWLAYTNSVTGRPMLTSTNTGHVLFLSWGDLPGNPWGIRVSDDDPAMIGELRAHFGRPVSSLGADGDRFLRERFMAMVLENPEIYGRRLTHHAFNLALGGFYPGVWDVGFRDRVRARFPEESLTSIIGRHWRDLPGLSTARTLIQVAGEIQARLGLLLLAGITAAAVPFAIRLRDFVALLLLAGVFYQMSVSLASPYLRPPLNNQIVPLVCLAVWWRHQRRVQSAAENTR